MSARKMNILPPLPEKYPGKIISTQHELEDSYDIKVLLYIYEIEHEVKIASQRLLREKLRICNWEKLLKGVECRAGRNGDQHEIVRYNLSLDSSKNIKPTGGLLVPDESVPWNG